MKILCAVMGCKLHRDLGYHDVIRDTWGRELEGFADLKFFIGETANELCEDEVRLSVRDDKDSLMYKVSEICNYALQENYNSIFKVNTNTYVDVPKIRETEHWTVDYAGASVGTLGNLYAGTEAFGFIQGSASWLSEKAAKIVCKDSIRFMTNHSLSWMKYNGLICPYPHAEDLWIGQVLTPHLSSLTTATDHRYSNGPLTYWSQSNYIKTQRLSEWMHALHNEKTDSGRDYINKKYQREEL